MANQNEIDSTVKKVELVGHLGTDGAKSAYKALSDDFSTQAQKAGSTPQSLSEYVRTITGKVQSDDPQLAGQIRKVWAADHTSSSIDAAHRLAPDGSDMAKVLDPKNTQWSELDREMVRGLLSQVQPSDLSPPKPVAMQTAAGDFSIFNADGLKKLTEAAPKAAGAPSGDLWKGGSSIFDTGKPDAGAGEKPLPPAKRQGDAVVERPMVSFPTEKAAEIPKILDNMRISEDHKQMVVVVGDGANSPTGTLQLYQRVDGHWQATNQSWPVNVGSRGLAWGDGMIQNSGSFGQQKQEGDKKAPAGLFSIGTAFGRSDSAPAGTRMPYKTANSNDFFVDDPGSSDYNKWVTLRPGDNPKTHWNSFERMQRNDNLYDMGLVVNHNMSPVVPGDGSAIFMHIWRGPGKGTDGCTSMSAGNLKSLLGWLDPKQQPLLLQVPNENIDYLKRAEVRRGA